MENIPLPDGPGAGGKKARGPAWIPVSRPLLPKSSSIAPYLSELDHSRRYANDGFLVHRFEERVAKLFGMPADFVCAAASGTAALSGAILATAGRPRAERPVCLVPSYTFAATPLAVEQCGFRVQLADIDASTWAMDPELVSTRTDLDKIGLVVPVAPYGRRFESHGWERFLDRTGIPVVIDGAACFEKLADDPDLVGVVPIALSFHATKSFGVGEGGAVLCRDEAVSRAVRASLNFGFEGVRSTSRPGFNGKMSEFHAAVGLAELDGWPTKRHRLERVAGYYRQLVGAKALTIHTAPEISGCYALFEAGSAEKAAEARASLTQAGIDTRLWYGSGMHREPYFRTAARDPTPVVDLLAPRLIGLPTAPDLDQETVAHIVAVLLAAASS